MKNILYKKKMFLLKTASLLLGFGVLGLSQAATTNAKSGSFDYVIPTGSSFDSCPSPYDSMPISATNNTGYQYEYYGNHGRPLAINIYYVLNDKRNYTGQYTADSFNDTSLYPIEVKNKTTPTGDWASFTVIDDKKVEVKGDSSGPIIGAYLIKNKQQEPTRSWSDSDTAYADMVSNYGESNVHVITEDFMHGDSTYMDWMGYTIPTLHIPARSYKAIFIEVVSGSVSYNNPTGRFYVMKWRGVAVSDKPGSQLKTTLSEVFYKKSADTSYGLAKVIPHLPLNGLIDMRAVDNITINAKGDNADSLFSASDIVVNYLKDKKTGKTVVCQ